jgi:hypothetical protein
MYNFWPTAFKHDSQTVLFWQENSHYPIAPNFSEQRLQKSIQSFEQMLALVAATRYVCFRW